MERNPAPAQHENKVAESIAKSAAEIIEGMTPDDVERQIYKKQLYKICSSAIYDKEFTKWFINSKMRDRISCGLPQPKE